MLVLWGQFVTGALGLPGQASASVGLAEAIERDSLVLLIQAAFLLLLTNINKVDNGWHRKDPGPPTQF